MRFILMLAGLLASNIIAAAPGDVAIVPKPVVCRMAYSGSFDFSASTRLYTASSELSGFAGIFASQVEPILGFTPAIKNGKGDENAVNLWINAQLEPEEYIINMYSKVIEIQGGSPQGVFHGLQSLRQVLMQYKSGNSANIPSFYVEDKPYLPYRAMMLDVCRHFSTVDEVKVFIDMLSLHKLNIFHWHLTDDQGWRMPVDSYPLLTEVGAERKQTVIGHARDSKTYDGEPYGKGMYYTKDQLREVIEYAAARGIEVIPEIEMPGHALAALASYPWLGCIGEEYDVCQTFGVFEDVFCAGKETTFRFMEAVVDEVLEVFPSKYIHIGGDECPKTRWEQCPHCQQRIKENGLADEHELQSYFMKRMEAYINSKGKSVIGWEELLEGGISPTATVMAWRDPSAAIEAAKNGNRVIMAPSKFCYLDYYQSEDKENEPFAIGGYVPVSKVYSVDLYDGLNENEKKSIWGLQANLWREYITTMHKIQYMVLPRMAALAESGWSYDRRDYEDFVSRMNNLRLLYEVSGYNYATHMFEQ